ncbi:MAG: nitroreductase [Candidatus Bathyarchaeota archaeon]|uniref:nitroreductase family protein n=1 Tax=Candidatus Bathycorpusculum sp. TaxID=2994959 RepID=UPI00282921AB|nr:nitroreductase [Candidatus Termiticorpusculum sp.]MCL2292046.1 nitroreductase [Candidatus Termiticorpusculum sp.]
MSLSEIIYKRKSIRKYSHDFLDEKTLQNIQNHFTKIKPLYGDINVKFNITSKANMNGMNSLFSPHYIVAMSENKKGHLVNVGFMLQQMDLYLSSIGIGGCWLGMAHPKETPNNDDNFEFVIAFGFGKPDESLYREIDEFNRKSLDKISNISDSRLEVVRLAPTAMNLQHYYFITEGSNIIHAYCKKPGLLTLKQLAKMREIDIGIALAHLYIANNERFKFFETPAPVEVKGHFYVGSIEI